MTKGNPKWEKWEHDIQELFGLDSCPGSGNQFNAPGDAVSNATPHDSSFRLFVDCKYTSKLSYSLTRLMWEKWSARAAEAGKRPAIAIRWDNDMLLSPKDVVVVDPNDLAELLDAALRLEQSRQLYQELPPNGPWKYDPPECGGHAV